MRALVVVSGGGSPAPDPTDAKQLRLKLAHNPKLGLCREVDANGLCEDSQGAWEHWRADDPMDPKAPGIESAVRVSQRGIGFKTLHWRADEPGVASCRRRRCEHRCEGRDQKPAVLANRFQ